jgi:hypothetical protein
MLLFRQMISGSSLDRSRGRAAKGLAVANRRKFVVTYHLSYHELRILKFDRNVNLR